MNQYWYFALGFAAQALFSVRTLVQWVLSERSKRVVSPAIYWQLSLLASFLFCCYGWLRADFAIVLGQLCSYYIYIWNLDVQQRWRQLPAAIRIAAIALPIAATALLLMHGSDSFNHLWNEMPVGLMLFGTAGQLLFTLRFVYQWRYSRSRGESLLPAGFWWLSLIGSACIIVYGIYRKDPVLLVGQGAGFITYSRNLWIDKHS